MKHEQVTVDYWTMLTSSFTYLALIFAGWVLLKLILAIFWFPAYLQKREKLSKKQDESNVIGSETPESKKEN